MEIFGEVEVFKEISERLKDAGIKPEEAGLRMIPNAEVYLDEDDTLQVFKFIEELEELDDVQEVYSNLGLSEELVAILEKV